MKISVIINTLNRSEELQRTLASFALQTYRDFEIIVVAGPCDDRTPQVVSAWGGYIKAANCPEPNLSMSRNIGIAAAAGDIVAFIDDDAIPEPRWLERIAQAYRTPDVGGAGGWVHDATGHAYQTKYIVCDRFAAARTDMTVNPTPHYNCPGGVEYCSLLGTNSSFLRSALIEMGGFDEEFAYYLDETDVCVRLVDRGFKIVFVEDARVLHKFQPSHMRNERRVLRNRYQIIKNQCYFSFRHGAPTLGYVKALAETQKFVEKHRQDVNWCVGAGLLDADAVRRYEEEAEQGIRDGLVHALAQAPSYQPLAYFTSPHAFLPFALNARQPGALTIVILSQSFPPGYVDGVGRFTAELAYGLAELGHEVHVITRSTGDNRVDLEDMVWVHRLKPQEEGSREADVPAGIWAHSITALEEIRLIQETSPIDVIQAPIWDVEGIAALRYYSSDAVLVTSLHTPMLVAAATHPHWLVDHGRMLQTILPIARLEREMLLFSDGIYANSHEIVKTIEKYYSVSLDAVHVVPHGMRDRRPGRPAAAAGGVVRVLFVGRLETRKGIDVLLGALPKVFDALPDLEIYLVGQDHTEVAGGQSTVSSFQQKHAAESWLPKVRFFGKIEKEFLDEYYESCDVVVMPSRYESFGLVLLEAMMHGRPVIAAGSGGMKEIVVPDETGLLTAPGDIDALADALIRLASDAELRHRLGANGRQRYEAKFTAHKMAEWSVAMYRQLLDQKRDGKLLNQRNNSPRPAPLCRAWSVADFWHKSELRRWTTDEWFFPSVPIWITLLTREALFRQGGAKPDLRTLVMGSSEPIDFIESVFPRATCIARADLPHIGLWADSSMPKRELDMLGLRDEDYDIALVLKPLADDAARQKAALRELTRLLRPAGLLAFVTASPIGPDVAAFLAHRGLATKDLNLGALEPHKSAAAPAYAYVLTRLPTPNETLGPPAIYPGAVAAIAAE